jgi:hypothetical protein
MRHPPLFRAGVQGVLAEEYRVPMQEYRVPMQECKGAWIKEDFGKVYEMAEETLKRLFANEVLVDITCTVGTIRTSGSTWSMRTSV